MKKDNRKLLIDSDNIKLPTKGFDFNNFKYPENWKGYLFRDLFRIFGGKSIPRSQFGGKGIACLHYGDIHMTNKSSLNLDEKYEKVPKTQSAKYNENDLLIHGDIVFADASEDYEGIGKSIVILNESEKEIIGGLHTYVARNKTNLLDTGFSKYVFNDWLIRKQFMFEATGISVFGIKKTSLENTFIVLPPIDEQEKIALILTNKENYINLLEEKISVYIKYRETLMKKMIKKHSDKNKNSNIKIKTLLKNRTEYVGDRNIQPVSVGIYGIRLRSDVYEKVLSDDYSKNKVIKKNDLCFGIGTNNIVYDVLFEDEIYCVSPAYRVYEVINVDPYYLKSYLDTYNGYLSNKYMIISVRQGKSIDMKGLLNEKIYLPSIDVQKKIRTVLENLDRTIELLKQKKELSETKYKSLMAKLLTGKIRVS